MEEKDDSETDNRKAILETELRKPTVDPKVTKAALETMQMGHSILKWPSSFQPDY